MAGNDAESVTFALVPPGQPSQSKEPSVAVVFSKCIAIYRQALSAIGKRVAVLSGTHQDQSMRALDEYGRIRMWGEQTKAVLQSESRGSLDNMLRKDEQLRGAVLNILTSLQAHLEMLCSIIDRLETGGSPDVHASAELDSDGDEYSSSSGDEESDQDLEPAKGRKSPRIESLLGSVSESIDTLFRFSLLLDRPGLQRRYLHSTGKAEFDSRIAHFETYDLKHVQEKLHQWKIGPKYIEDDEIETSPEALDLRTTDSILPDQNLVGLSRRLARANTKRREQLLYWGRHPDAPPLSQIQRSITEVETLPHRPSTVSQPTTAVPPIVPKVQASEKMSQVPPSMTTVQSFSHVAVSVQLESESAAGPPRTIYTESTSGKRGSTRVPDLPKSAVENAQFDCPYCHTQLQSSMMVNRLNWKHHVFRDLRPYMCTFPDCQNPDKQYTTRHDWALHEQQMHRRQWVCEEHDQAKFGTKELFKAHIKKEHSDTSERHHLSILMEVSERPIDEDKIVACPLCPDELYLRTLRTHLSKHLEDIALSVLPLNIEDDEDADSQKAAGSGAISDIESETEGSSRTSSRIQGDIATSASDSIIEITDTGSIEDPPGHQNVEFEYTRVTPFASYKGLLLHQYSIPASRLTYGREEVLQLIDDYFYGHFKISNDDSVRSLAIRGFGGMGKTATANEYAHRCKAAGTYDAIFWIHANQHAKFFADLRKVAIDLQLISEDSFDDHVVTLTLVTNRLSEPMKQSAPNETDLSPVPWLLVVDGLEEPDILSELRSIKGPGCILITTRNSSKKMSQAFRGVLLNLEPLKVEDSCQILKEITGTEEDVRIIGSKLGGVPYALIRTAHMVREGLTNFNEILEYYNGQDTHSEYWELGIRHTALLIKNALSNLWTLKRIEKYDYGRILLDVIAFLDPDDIQEWVLRKNVDDLLIHYPYHDSDYTTAREELLQGSLISMDLPHKYLTVHPMVQEVVRSQMEPSHYVLAFSAALRLVSLSWPFKPTWSFNKNLYDKEKQLIFHIVRMMNMDIKSFRHLLSEDVQRDYCQLMIDAGRYHIEKGDFRLAKALVKSAQKTAKFANTSDTIGKTLLEGLIATGHFYLGCIGAESNQPTDSLSSFDDLDEMVAFNEDICKADELLPARASYGVGTGWMMNRNWSEGELCFLQSIETAKRLQKFDPVDYHSSYINLGLAYWLSRRYDDARKILEEGHRILDNTSDVLYLKGRSSYAIGNVLASQGVMQLSVRYHTMALDLFRQTLVRHHHRIGDVCVRVAEHYLRMDFFNEAIAHIDEALRIFSNATFLPERARALFRKSAILEAAGNVTEAKSCREESLKYYHEVTGRIAEDIVTDEDFDDIVAFWSR